MKLRRVVAGPAAAVVLLLLLTGCPKSTPHEEILLTDISHSAQHTDLVQLGEERTFAVVQQMKAGDKVTVRAFNAYPGAACDPLVLDIPTQNNSEEAAALQTQMLTDLPANYNAYLSCLAGQPTGGGSAIFGAIAEARTAEPQAQSIQVVTDGCSYKETSRSCRKASLNNPEFSKTFVNQMPEALCPSMRGVQVTFVGLGRGTSLNATQLAALRSLFTTWGDRTNADVQFA